MRNRSSYSLFIAIAIVTVSRFFNRVHCALSISFFVDENNDATLKLFNNTIRSKVADLQTLLKDSIDFRFYDTKGSEAGTVKAFFKARNISNPQLVIGASNSPGSWMLARLASAAKVAFLSAGTGSEGFLYDATTFGTFVTPSLGLDSAMELIRMAMTKYKWTRAFVISSTTDYYQTQANFIFSYLNQFGNSNNRMRIYLNLFNSNQNTGGDGTLEYKTTSADSLLERAKDRATLIVFLMPFDDVKLFVKEAKRLSMLDGSRAFLTLHAAESQDFHPQQPALETVGMLTLDRMNYSWTQEFEAFVYKQMQMDPSLYQLDPYFLKLSALIYDGLTIWGMALEGLKSKQPDSDLMSLAKHGTEVAKMFRQMSWEGLSGLLKFSANGSRLGKFALEMIQGLDRFQKILTYDSLTGNFSDLNPTDLVWPGGSRNPPVQPSCFGVECLKEQEAKKRRLLIIITSTVCGIIAVVFVVALASSLIWKRHQERQLISSRQIKWSEVVLLGDAENSSFNNQLDRKSNASSILTRFFVTAGMYKGTVIAIKYVQRSSVSIFDRDIYRELKQMLYVKHDNVNYFVGVCAESPNICVAMTYADKGSLQNVLADPKLEIDWEFRMSLAMDVAKGMDYLHEKTAIGTHGHLTSSNCVVDERWNCKITDYGLKQFRNVNKIIRHSTDLLWTAPELLQKKDSDSERAFGTKPGDVYSFGVIISELLTRELPYHDGLGSNTLEEVLAKVKVSSDPPFRPTLPTMEGNVAEDWMDLARNCWQTDSTKRPTFKTIKAILLATNSGKFTNVLERMQNFLEESNERANTELSQERRKTEAMMHGFLPRAVVEMINSGKEVDPEFVESAVLCLCDSTGIYKATNELPAVVVVDILRNLYRKYDEVINKHNAYEVSIWGSKDSMLIAGGLSVNPNTDATAICLMALELMSCIETFQHQRLEKRTLQMKITVHIGSVYTALIGKQIPQFCVFGESVHEISDIHSSAKFMTIRITHPVRDIISKIGNFRILHGGKVSIGESKELATYFITGKDDYTQPLPIDLHRKSSVDKRPSKSSPRKSSSTKKRKVS